MDTDINIPPLSSTNYLYMLDRITQEVIDVILSARQLGVYNKVIIPKYGLTVQGSGTAAELTRLRRQFLVYSKMQQIKPDQAALLFIQYLNKSL